MFEKDMRIADLIDIYGVLLPQRRRDIIEAYYYEDFSLSEISDNTGISRQGVRDSIKKSETELREFEEKLHLLEKSNRFQTDKDEITARLLKISTTLPSPHASEIIKISDLLKELNILG